MRTLFIALLGLVVAPSLALAGTPAGGGTKNTSTITARKTNFPAAAVTTNALIVFVDTPAATLQQVLANPTQAAVTAAGGQIVATAGFPATASFGGLQSGNHQVTAVFSNGAGGVGVPAQKTFNIAKGYTLNLNVQETNGTNAAPGAAVIFTDNTN